MQTNAWFTTGRAVALLFGIRVVDSSRMLAGAALVQLIAGTGADVIKIERPGSGDYIRRSGNRKRGSK